MGGWERGLSDEDGLERGEDGLERGERCRVAYEECRVSDERRSHGGARVCLA